jgi:hypothetical protein
MPESCELSNVHRAHNAVPLEINVEAIIVTVEMVVENA